MFHSLIKWGKMEYMVHVLFSGICNCDDSDGKFLSILHYLQCIKINFHVFYWISLVTGKSNKSENICTNINSALTTAGRYEFLYWIVVVVYRGLSVRLFVLTALEEAINCYLSFTCWVLAFRWTPALSSLPIIALRII